MSQRVARASAFGVVAVVAVVAVCGPFALAGCAARPGGGLIEGDGGLVTAPDGAVLCTAGMYWRGGDRESELMNPGQACVACHVQRREGPAFTIAGTVYPSLHEEDDCLGVGAGAATVEITDATGQTLTLATNSAGNFSSEARVTFPIHARVRANGRVLEMSGAQTTGDCNSCHTQAGANLAPGRIMAP